MNSINEYLEFDCKELFVDPLIRIFGGAVRDSICGDDIHDIDILCGAISNRKIENILTKHGYTYMENLQPKDLSRIYTDIHIINEPHTWMKGNKIVQLIRPVIPNKNSYADGYRNLICNVDISCCGVSFDGYNIYENYKNSILHCMSKTFTNINAKMYNIDRIIHRRQKLINRGWTELDIINNREVIINGILYSDSDIKYITELD
jgi:hypothetical protein